jgi:hypothetical protein
MLLQRASALAVDHPLYIEFRDTAALWAWREGDLGGADRLAGVAFATSPDFRWRRILAYVVAAAAAAERGSQSGAWTAAERAASEARRADIPWHRAMAALAAAYALAVVDPRRGAEALREAVRPMRQVGGVLDIGFHLRDAARWHRDRQPGDVVPRHPAR